MLNLNSIMVGSQNPQKMGEFYKKVFEKPADMEEGGWYSWQVGSCFFSVGEHSEVKGEAKEPERVMLNLETPNVKEEFERIKNIEGVKVIKEPYGLTAKGEPTDDESGMWIATLADPDGNYFQLMSPWGEAAN